MLKILRKATVFILVMVICLTIPLTAFAEKDDPIENEEPVLSSDAVDAPNGEIAVPMPVPEPVVGGGGGASASNEESMETALIAVRRLINLDEDIYTNFNYYSSYTNYETREGLIWTFEWQSQDDGFVYARAAADGTLLEYRLYNWQAVRYGFADVEKETAIKKADEFIKAANPDTYTYYKTPADTSISIHGSDYNFSYAAEVNGLPFNAASISVSVNKFSGDIVGYSTRNINPARYVFEAAEPIIGEEAAISAYAEKIGLSLEYRSNFDYQKGEIKVYPAYTFNSFGDRFINAKTGEVAEYVYDRGVAVEYNEEALMSDAAPAPAEAEADAGGFGRQNLTPAELEALERVSTLITPEQALENLLEIMEMTDLNLDSFDQHDISLRREYFDKSRFAYDIRLWSYSARDGIADGAIYSISGKVDADSGRVLAFNYASESSYARGSNEQPAIDSEKAQGIAEDFLKKHAPDEFVKTELDTERSRLHIPLPRWGGGYNFNYTRYVNDIPYRDNAIRVTVEPDTGKITSYSLDWFTNVTFPSVSNVLTQEAALTAFVDQNGYSVFYITIGDGKTALVYDFASHWMVDPFTGKALNYDGEPRTDADTEIPDYSDVKGHWSEPYVNRLLDNGVFLWGGAFEPNKKMTQSEFLDYIMLSGSSSPIMPLYEGGSSNPIISDADRDKIVTKQTAARIMVDYLNYGEIAKESKWFVYPFNDSADESLKGYITIAHILGIVGGDGGGNFNATSDITHAQAAVMLHNIIARAGA